MRTSKSRPGGPPPVDSPPMTNLDEQGRPEPPLAAGETATLLGFLDYQRETLAWKCSGLDAAGLRATVAASSMTLGGMLKHLAAGRLCSQELARRLLRITVPHHCHDLIWVNHGPPGLAL